MFVSLASTANASPDQDTVINDGGKIVVSKYGACVRSKWQAGSDACAPEAAPEEKKPMAQAPVVQPDRDQRTVYFDFNSANLTMNAVQKLDALVSWIAGAKGVTSATVVGFADQIGNTDYNQKLSERRASAVQSYLRSRGVTLPTNVEVVKGMGESGSITQCDASASREQQIVCLAADRRVEIKFEIVR
jgi:OOP family OmpA-OmpF porin